MKLGHPTECIIAYPRQSVAVGNWREVKLQRKRINKISYCKKLFLVHTCWGAGLWGFPDQQRHEVWCRRWYFWIMSGPPNVSCLQNLFFSHFGQRWHKNKISLKWGNCHTGDPHYTYKIQSSESGNSYNIVYCSNADVLPVEFQQQLSKGFNVNGLVSWVSLLLMWRSPCDKIVSQS